MTARKRILDSDVARADIGDRLCLCHFFGPPRAEDLRTLGDAQLEWVNEHGAPLASMTFISTSVGLKMGAEARAEAARVQKQGEDYLVGNATIIEEAGFFASIVRSIIASLQLLGGGKAVVTVFEDRQSAAEWVVGRLDEAGHKTSAENTLAAINALIGDSPGKDGV